jgi:hypothetical protein
LQSIESLTTIRELTHHLRGHRRAAAA